MESAGVYCCTRVRVPFQLVLHVASPLGVYSVYIHLIFPYIPHPVTAQVFWPTPPTRVRGCGGQDGNDAWGMCP